MEQAGKPQPKRSASVRDSGLGRVVSPMTMKTHSTRQRKNPQMCKRSRPGEGDPQRQDLLLRLWEALESYERCALIREWQGAGERLTVHLAQVCLSLGDLLNRLLAHVDVNRRTLPEARHADDPATGVPKRVIACGSLQVDAYRQSTEGAR